MQSGRTAAPLMLLAALLLGGASLAQADNTMDLRRCMTLSPANNANLDALNSAYPVVMGNPAWVTCATVQEFAGEISKPPYNMGAEWQEGMKFTDAVKFLKIKLAHPGMAAFRAQTIDYAFVEVYGRPSSPIEQAQWENKFKNQQAWYASMVAAEQKKLNASKAERQAMLDRVYQAGMGRNSDAGDQGYWLPRPEHFRLIVEANRKWLYSANGVNDLVQTTTRALTAKTGKPPSDAQIKTAMAQFTGARAIYSEMLKL